MIFLLGGARDASAYDDCVYSDRVYSEYGRLMSTKVNRYGVIVGEVVYVRQFDGYFVRCTKGGMSPQRYFGRARDARWAACGNCY